MVDIRIDGSTVGAGEVGTNDGLNWGRFEGDNLVVRPYSLIAPLEVLVDEFSESFAELVEETRLDDRLDDEPSALAKMGYPTLAEAIRHPKFLEDVLDVFLARDILNHFAPFQGGERYIINSMECATISAGAMTFNGRVFSRG